VTTIIFVLGFALAIHSIINGLLLRRPGNRDVVSERVAILIPARNEAANIKGCLETALDQRNLTDFHVFVLDDSSTDQTNAIVREVISIENRLTLIAGRELPEGWTGKNNACWQLANTAERFDYLVFLDADVRLRSDAVVKSINALRKYQWKFISPYPRQLARTWSEWLIQPLLQWSWITTLPLRLAERSLVPQLTAANGQFLIFEKDTYFTAGGHKAIHEEVLDDINLARQMKRNGFRGNVIDGSAIATCRMYQSWHELRDGYTKSLWSAFGSIPGAILVMIFLFSLYIFPALIALQGLSWGISLMLFAYISRLMAAVRSQSSLSSVAFHPIAITLLCYLIVRSWWLKRKNRLFWKSRTL
jgi:glycosyltransferase involved in cell wall biosynthesis